MSDDFTRWSKEKDPRWQIRGHMERIGMMMAWQARQPEIDALRAELEAVRKDAERYQFIRGGGAYIEPHPDSIYVATDRGNYMKTNSEFDAAIDAAMGEGNE